MVPDRDLVERAYAAFNARDIAGALATMHSDVEWPNGMEGGTVRGHVGVREYWTRQWTVVDPHVEPRQFRLDEAGRTVVRVYQIVRDMAGSILLDRMVEHIYTVENGLIRSMEIREVDAAGQSGSE